MPGHHPTSSEVRELLGQVRGVKGVIVQEGPHGDIQSIEIQVGIGQSYRRVTRDIESALMSGLGYSIDHRLITITHNGNGVSTWDPSWGLSEGPSAQTLQELWRGPTPLATPGRLELCGVRSEPDGRLYCQVTVEIELEAVRYDGQEVVADTVQGRRLAAGRAALKAVQRAVDLETALDLEGLEEFRIGAEVGLLALVRVRQGRERRCLQGAVLIDGDPVEAAARAVLDALNRFWTKSGSRVFRDLRERNE